MRYQASPALRAFILERAPIHIPVADAPSTFRGLQQWMDTKADVFHGAIPVFSGGSESTIYGEPAVNWAFRAWHDQTHLDLHADFGPMGERRVAEAHVRAAIAAGLPHADVSALWADTWGQYAYYMKHRAYVADQAAFVGACILRGVDAVVDSGETF